MRYIEIRVFEPEVRSPLGVYELNGTFSHPARIRYVDCFLHDDGKVQVIGSEGLIEFVDGVCLDFMGEFRAEIVGEIDAAKARSFRSDRFELVDEWTWRTFLKWMKGRKEETND